jgi:hypothetical protein
MFGFILKGKTSMTTSKEYKGTCTMCGAENQKLTIVDEEAHVCAECLDNEYFYCDECHEYWLCDAVEYFELEDGRTVCEYCAEDIGEQ